jgi:hypothetical protein
MIGRWRRRLGESRCSGAASVAGYADKGNGCSATRFAALEGKGKVSRAEGLKRGALVAFASRQRTKWRPARHQAMEEGVGVQPVLHEGLEVRSGKGEGGAWPALCTYKAAVGRGRAAHEHGK